jgi:HK97 family phage portal protein
VSIFDRFRRPAAPIPPPEESRSYNLEDPNVPIAAGTLGWVKPSRSGISVTSETAMRYSAVLACVRILAETLASLPLNSYRRIEGGGKEKARDHYSYPLLHNQPNPYMTHFSWVELAMIQVLLEGNHYSWIDIAANGIIRAIWPLDPKKTKPRIDAVLGLVYDTTVNGKPWVIPRDYMIHVPGMGFDGVLGKSLISWAAESIGLGVAIDEYGAAFFGDGAFPAGVLEHPGKPDDNAVQRIKQAWAQQYGGLANAQSVAVLREGMKYNPISVNPVDAQALEAARFRVSDIARIFRVPLMLLQFDQTTTTYASAEQFMLSFKQFSIQPWAVRFEQEISRKVYSAAEQKTYFAEFNLDGLLRGDFASRQTGLATMRQNGIINADEWRELENLNPLPSGAGKVYLNPMNMQVAGDKPQADSGLPGIDPASAAPDVASTALNGAQVAELVAIAQAVSLGTMPIDTAIEIVLIAFPTITRDEAEAMLKPLVGFTPAASGGVAP